MQYDKVIYPVKHTHTHAHIYIIRSWQHVSVLVNRQFLIYRHGALTECIMSLY